MNTLQEMLDQFSGKGDWMNGVKSGEFTITAPISVIDQLEGMEWSWNGSEIVAVGKPKSQRP